MNSNRNSRNIRLSGLKYYFQHQHNIISHWHFDYIIVLQCGNFSHTFLTQCENFSNNFPTQCGNLLFPNSNINFKSQDTRSMTFHQFPWDFIFILFAIRSTCSPDTGQTKERDEKPRCLSENCQTPLSKSKSERKWEISHPTFGKFLKKTEFLPLPLVYWLIVL